MKTKEGLPSQRRLALIAHRLDSGIAICGSLTKLAERIEVSKSSLSVLKNHPEQLPEETIEELMLNLKNVIEGKDKLSEEDMEQILQLKSKKSQQYFFNRLKE